MKITTFMNLAYSLMVIATPVSAAGRCCSASCAVCLDGTQCSNSEECEGAGMPFARCCPRKLIVAEGEGEGEGKAEAKVEAGAEVYGGTDDSNI
ncbi:hypothetical protein BKA59DRAFT_517268 [Fusarium tricinctum]|uniref:Uncharacterized protein n=1 Tax=Fusarium tricinctum TaxID=61284 RepID=A0A8K0RK83_9HYPO|nr:hypothetical protein BKA59DRAFT_517268 [Fusarium tricinctum]